MNVPVVNAALLRHVEACSRRVWLERDSRPETRQILPFMAETDAIRKVPATTPWSDALQITADWMGQGVRWIGGAAFERSLEVPAFVVVRERFDGLLRNGRIYEPVLIKHTPEITDADRLHLDLYLWLVAGVGAPDLTGWFWMGEDERIEHIFRREEFLAALETAVQILSMESPPPVFLGSHCQQCRWQKPCTEQARAEHNVTLLPRISHKTRRHIWETGVRTYDEIAQMSVDELQRFQGIGPVNVHDILSAAQAFTLNSPVWRGEVPDKLHQPGIMFDLETDLNIGAPWSFGWQVTDDPVQIVVVDRYCEPGQIRLPGGLWVTMVEHSDDAWTLLAQAAEQVPGLICHWTDFDRGVMRKSAPAHLVEVLDERMHDLHKTLKATVSLPVASTSIKVVAAYLGHTWPEGSNAFAAWDDYKRWLLEGDKYALRQASDYLQADVIGLSVVRHWLLNNRT